MMKLWLISKSGDVEYDTYDSAVVAARDEDAARRTHPDGRRWEDGHHGTWVNDPAEVTARYIGEAAPGIEAGVICASFNAA